MRPFWFLITPLVILLLPIVAMAQTALPWWEYWRGPTAAWMSRAIIQDVTITTHEDEDLFPGPSLLQERPPVEVPNETPAPGPGGPGRTGFFGGGNPLPNQDSNASAPKESRTATQRVRGLATATGPLHRCLDVVQHRRTARPTNLIVDSLDAVVETVAHWPRRIGFL